MEAQKKLAFLDRISSAEWSLPVRHGRREHPRVRHLGWRGGQERLLKISKNAGDGWREAAALRALAEVGAPVPQLDALGPEGLLLLEFIPGTAWPLLSVDCLQEMLQPFLNSFSAMSRAWGATAKTLASISDSFSKDDFCQQMTLLGQWLCPQAPYPVHAARAWQRVLALAVSAPLRFGARDYQPHNVICAQGHCVFVDFESFGYDWDFRRLWQYTTLIDGRWIPLLRPVLRSNPAADAHFILFAAAYLYRYAKTLQPLWDTTGSQHEATAAWRESWEEMA